MVVIKRSQRFLDSKTTSEWKKTICVFWILIQGRVLFHEENIQSYSGIL